MGILQVDGRPVVSIPEIANMLGKKAPNVYTWVATAPNFPKPVHVTGKTRLYLKSEVEVWYQLMSERKGRVQTLRSRLIAMDIADLDKVESLILHKISVREPGKTRVAAKAGSKTKPVSKK